MRLSQVDRLLHCVALGASSTGSCMGMLLRTQQAMMHAHLALDTAAITRCIRPRAQHAQARVLVDAFE